MELRSCYFCGVAGRTVESRSLSDVAVALCPRCEEKLARLRDATEAGTTEPTPVTFDATGDGDGGHSRTTATTDESGDEPGALGNEDATDVATDDSVDETEADGTVDDPPDDESADGPTDDRTADDPADGSDASDDSGSAGLRGLGADERGRRSTYRKALRLLRNREFPMARSDTLDLLASAYDLDREECEQLLDLCVDRGLLVEADGELREP